jgi:hypothetical protein
MVPTSTPLMTVFLEPSSTMPLAEDVTERPSIRQ